MKLTTISASCFMGGSFQVKLGDLNIVHGTNDSGKTRLGNLIKLLLLGYLPSLGKLPGELFKLSSGAIMEVTGVFDNRESIKRRWKQAGESIKSTHLVPPMFDNKTPLVLLNASDYFGRTARGRVEMVFSVAKIDDGESMSAIADTLYGILGDASMPLVGHSIQEWIDNALEAVEEARKTAAADVKRYTGTLQGLSALQLADKPATRSVEEIDADIQAEQNASADKRAKRTALDEAQGRNEQIELERADLQHRIEQAGDPVPREFDITALRAKEKELSAKIEAHDGWHKGHAEWLRLDGIRRNEIKRLADDVKNLVRLGTESLFPQIRKIEEAMSKRKTAKCRSCKQQIAPKPVKDENKLPALRNEQFIRAERERAVNRNKELIAELENQERAEPTGKPTDDVEVFAGELHQVRADIDEYVATADVQAWRKQLAEMVKPVDHSEAITLLQTEAHRHSERVTTLQNERKAAESDRQDRKRLAEAQSAQEAAITAETRYKEAKTFLLAKKAELIETVFGPLLDTAARFMHGIFPAQIEYRDGELGAFTGNSWVTEATFGGAKRALLHAALKCALGAQSPVKIILMDELLNMVTHLPKFMVNIRDAQQAGIIDQFIGLIPTGELFPQERIPRILGFTFIEASDNTYARA